MDVVVDSVVDVVVDSVVDVVVDSVVEVVVDSVVDVVVTGTSTVKTNLLPFPGIFAPCVAAALSVP